MKQLFVLFLLLALLAPIVASAVPCPPPDGPDNGLNLCYPQFPGAPFLQIDMPLTQIIAWVYIFIVGISGLAAFIMIVWGGVQWMTSAGNPTATGDAKDRIKTALLGLLLILSSFLILQVINPELTLLEEFKINPLSYAPLASSQFTADGVYVCRNANCQCAANPCIGGSWADGADYRWYNPNTWGVIFTSSDSGGVPQLGSWDDHVASLRILGPYGVLLADGENFTEEVICFQGFDSTIYAPNLGNIFHDGGKPWSEDGAQSLKILGDGVCSENRVTFPNEILFWGTVTPAFAIDLTILIDGVKCESSPGVNDDTCSMSAGDYTERIFEWESGGATCKGLFSLTHYIQNDSPPNGTESDKGVPQEFNTPKDYVFTLECSSDSGAASDTVTINIGF